MHLLTAEAVKMYLDKLKPDGVVLLHTSNRYLDLELVLSATLKELPPGTAGIVVSDNEADGSYAQSTSNVVIFTKSEQALQPYRSLPGVIELDEGGLRALDGRLLRPARAVPEPYPRPVMARAGCGRRASPRFSA